MRKCFRVRECELTGLLSTRVYLDLWDADEAGATNALAQGLATLYLLRAPGAGSATEAAPAYPYLLYDYFVTYYEAEAQRVDVLTSQLESLQKKVWRDVWTLAGSTPVRKKNRPGSLRCSCHVVCAGDATPDEWADHQIQTILDRQQQDRNLKFVPVAFGKQLDRLKQTFRDVLFWGDASNAITLLRAAAADTNLAPPDPVTQKTDEIKTCLVKLEGLKQYLEPNVVQQAQLDAIGELRKATYGRTLRERRDRPEDFA